MVGIKPVEKSLVIDKDVNVADFIRSKSFNLGEQGIITINSVSNTLASVKTPEGLSIDPIEVGDTAVITWDEVHIAEGYNVYLDDGTGFEKYNEELLEDTEYEIEGLSAGEYDVRVTSSNHGVESDPSSSVLLEVLDLTSFELFTVLDVDTNWDGNTFYLETGLERVFLTGFDFNLGNMVRDLKIYYKLGDHTYDINDYTLIHHEVAFQGNGNQGVDNHLDLPEWFMISSSTKIALFTVFIDGVMFFGEGSQSKEGSAGLSYTSDRGVSNETFDATTTSRRWNGRIYYDAEGA